MSVLKSVLLFVACERMSSVWDAVEDADKVAVVEETDDSCTAHPAHTLTDSHCSTDFTGPEIEVKWENYPDMKVEDADENDVECKDLSVKVRHYAIDIVIFLMYAVHDVMIHHYLCPPSGIWQAITFSSCGFFFLVLSISFSSPILSRYRLDVYHTSLLPYMMWP